MDLVVIIVLMTLESRLHILYLSFGRQVISENKVHGIGSDPASLGEKDCATIMAKSDI